MKICGWMEQGGGPHTPTIVWGHEVESFLESLIAQQEFSSDIFEEIENALSCKICRREGSQKIVIFSEHPKFPTLAVHLLKKGEEAERYIFIAGVGIHIGSSPCGGIR